MDTSPNPLYRSSETYELVIYDVRIPTVADRLRARGAAWGEDGDTEALDEHHFVLIVRLGSAHG
jgi:hypothetical protein